MAYAVGDETGGVVTGWLPASLLRPHGTTTELIDEPGPELAAGPAHRCLTDQGDLSSGDVDQGRGTPYLEREHERAPVDDGTIRTWARAVGLPVAGIGRVSNQVRQAFNSTHQP